ncbi:MAG: hypothetical protein M3135_03720 [Actinomycetota bacterium]|nr:hypothetical protein [Actinomycetota bacterium]
MVLGCSASNATCSEANRTSAAYILWQLAMEGIDGGSVSMLAVQRLILRFIEA